MSSKPAPPASARASSGSWPRSRPRADGRRDAATPCARRGPRAVVDEERERLAAGGDRAAPLERLADEVVDRLDELRRPRTGVDRSSTRPASSSTRTSAARRGPRPRSRRGARPRPDYLLLELDRDDRPARRRVPPGRGAPHRADRRGGRARHEQQRGGAWRSPSGSPAAAAASSCRAASSSRSAAACGSRRSSAAPARKLIEVGTTNRTRAADFEAPLAEGGRRAVLRVHPSNFTMAGFTEAPDPAEVAELAHRHGAIVIDDLGIGALLDTARVRAGPRADARRAPGGGLGRRHVQRRQARRRAAGRARRRSRATSSRGCGATRWRARCGRTR